MTVQSNSIKLTIWTDIYSKMLSNTSKYIKLIIYTLFSLFNKSNEWSVFFFSPPKPNKQNIHKTIETKAKTPSYLNCSRDKVDDEIEEEDQI